MELYTLQVFLTVATERSFSRAAARLHRTQPAVSQVIAKLEAELGETLLERSSRDASAIAVIDTGRSLPAPAGASEMGARLASPVEEDVISALVNLGYQRAAADKALFGARGGKSPQSFEALFREALGLLSK